MNETVRELVDRLFVDTVENEETKALREELLTNCQERYLDLVARGLSEEEAIKEVEDSLGGMKDVIAEYPRKSTAVFEETEKTGGSWQFTEIDCLTAETTDQDLFVSPSADGAIHVYCDDPNGLTCETAGKRVIIRGTDQPHRAAAAVEKPEGEEITLASILDMVGRVIRNVTAAFQNGAAIRIEVPDGAMAEIELNSRSGDIFCSCALARQMTARSTSGDVRLDPIVEKTADSLLISTVSGEAEVKGSAMDGEITSMSGDVEVDGVFEALKLKSTSGDVDFSGSVEDLKAVSVSGDVTLSVENGTVRRVDGRSTSGDVEIRLPAGIASVHAECASRSGDVLSRISDDGMGAAVQIQAKSVSGDVTVEQD